MVCPYADKDHWVNPKGYKFALDNVSYYNECGDVGNVEPSIGDPDLSKTNRQYTKNAQNNSQVTPQ